MSQYSTQRENLYHSQKITAIISRWKADCGFTPTVSQRSLKPNTKLDIQNALNALSCLYTIPKIHLSGTSAELSMMGKIQSTCSPADVRIVWYFNPNQALLSTIYQQLSSLKILQARYELVNPLTQYHSLVQKHLQHRLTTCLRLIKSLRGSTTTKLVKEEVQLLDSLAAYLQKLQIS